MKPTKPAPAIEAAVRKAYMELMTRVHATVSPAAFTELRQDIEDVWLPREHHALRTSMLVAGFTQHIVADQERMTRAGVVSTVKDEEFAAALLLEYLAFSEGIFKLDLCHIVILASYAGQSINIRGLPSPKSNADLLRSTVSVEDLVRIASEAGFGTVLTKMFSNQVRRAVAHMDLKVGTGGVVTLYDTDKRGNRTQVGPPLTISDLQAKCFALRDFSHALVLAMRSYAVGERGLGIAG